MVQRKKEKRVMMGMLSVVMDATKTVEVSSVGMAIRKLVRHVMTITLSMEMVVIISARQKHAGMDRDNRVNSAMMGML
jgi:hypothetical protein